MAEVSSTHLFLLLTLLHARDHGMPLKGPMSHKYTEGVGQGHPANAAFMFTDSGSPSLTISCSVASAPQQHSLGRCSSSSEGCSIRDPEEIRFRKIHK